MFHVGKTPSSRHILIQKRFIKNKTKLLIQKGKKIHTLATFVNLWYQRVHKGS